MAVIAPAAKKDDCELQSIHSSAEVKQVAAFVRAMAVPLALEGFQNSHSRELILGKKEISASGGVFGGMSFVLHVVHATSWPWIRTADRRAVVCMMKVLLSLIAGGGPCQCKLGNTAIDKKYGFGTCLGYLINPS